MKQAQFRILGTLVFSFFVLITLPVAEAKDLADVQGDLRFQPYVFAGPASFISYGGNAFEFGGGMDWLVYKGLGLGFSMSVVGDGYSAVGSGSLDVSYHFIRRTPGLVPTWLPALEGPAPPSTVSRGGPGSILEEA